MRQAETLRQPNPSKMPRNRCVSPLKLYQDAQRSVPNPRRTQIRQKWLTVVDPKNENGTNDSDRGDKTQGKKGLGNTNTAGKKKGMEPKTSTEQLIKTNGSASSWDISRTLTMLKSQSTYCLTGSKVFWTIDQEVAPTGTWRP